MIKFKMRKKTKEFLYQIPGYEDYFITKEGQVWSAKRSELKPIKACQGKTRYWQVSLNSVSKNIHRILAQLFIPNPQKKLCVNHIDGDRSNNKLSNLEWVTHSENNYHAYKVGLATSKYREKPIQKICLLTNSVLEEYSSLLEAATKNKIQFKNISKVCKKERNSAGGYSWRYLNEA